MAALIQQKTNTGDLLLFDVRLHALHGWNGRRELTPKEKDSLIRGYDHETCHRFVFGPIEVATSAVASDVTFTYDVNRTITAVPGAVNVIIRCSPLETRMRLTGETVRTGVLNLAATTLYDFEQLLNWIPTTGLHPVWNKKVRNTGLFLLQKM